MFAKSKTKGRVYNGQIWTDVLPEKPVEPKRKKKKNPLSFFRRRSSASSTKKDEVPVPPAKGGNGKILVTIPSFRDGQRCGETLVNLFQNAYNPDNIVVSLVEQQHEDDIFCVEAFCKAVADVEIIQRKESQSGGYKVFSDEGAKQKCHRIDQIRSVRVQDSAAKGPPWARALGRRSLGNEEYCLQFSTHGELGSNWDLRILKEWWSVKNEFAVLSNPLQTSLDTERSVPRTCGVKFLQDERLPYYESEPEGKAEELEKPLLAHTWAPGFSFAKCHLEEAAPADGFLRFVPSDVEAFARYARMWTRGYDVYTPTKNFAFARAPIEDPHKTEWMDKWRGQKTTVLEESLKRIRSYLEIPEIGSNEAPTEKLDNMGIYGIGKRRTLKQFNEFVGIDLVTQQSRAVGKPCENFEWVPYDSDISPMDNLYSNPDDLDPQPEFPLRTQLIFGENYGTDFSDLQRSSSLDGAYASPLDSSRVPYGTLIFLWVLGLILWCYVHAFSFSTPNTTRVKRRKKRINKDK
eukprot:CAMPEP_0197184714 /NCGR_PEP_ID=MMETSP1423-20130617/10409_1 /TAXON_ID=476441 /ORGANISM="Pseudo-nitzschia heimii, Strain UNC1101" /LENGTH=518 /DNA_ID=CAMNT_0042635597 /DNA_START=253 /DNA_END=1809 /DNA_ORIENTATION=+